MGQAYSLSRNSLKCFLFLLLASYNALVPSLTIVYASTSGHTEHVVDTLAAMLRERAPEISLTLRRAEQARPEDLTAGDVLVLASGTWNTSGTEGQLNPHMRAFLLDRAAEVDLAGKPCAVISLGDSRYRYTCRATEHLMQFILQHGGKNCCPPLAIVNEPWGQEERIGKWGEKLLTNLKI